jgi:DNA-binding transcriptional LysR family regulator
MPLDTRLLRNFLVVAEYEHFREAAEVIGTSQPALSQQIRALEAELGVELFERAKRRVRLTAAGALYRTEVAEVLARLETANLRTREAQLGRRGNLIIGASSPAVLSDVPTLIDAYRRASPDVTIALKIMRSNDLFEALNAREMDVGFTRGAGAQPDLLSAPMWAHPYRLILPQRHPLARHAEVDLAALRDEALIMYHRSSVPESFDHIIAMCHELGFDPRRIDEVAGIEPAIGLIACGFGVMILPTPWERTIGLPEIAFRPIARSEKWTFRIDLCWNRQERSALTTSFLNFARKRVAEKTSAARRR